MADAVVHALQKHLPEVPVPGYLSAITPLQGLAPHWLLRGIRRVFDDQRILGGLDESARAGYNQRINALTKPTARKQRG